MRIIKIELQGTSQSKTPCPKGRMDEGKPIMVGTYRCHRCSCFDKIIVDNPELPISRATCYVKCNAHYPQRESNQ